MLNSDGQGTDERQAGVCHRGQWHWSANSCCWDHKRDCRKNNGPAIGSDETKGEVISRWRAGPRICRTNGKVLGDDGWRETLLKEERERRTH